MAIDTDTDAGPALGGILRAFLLRELPEEGDAYVEDKLLPSAEYRDELLVAEDDLFDDYVSGLLMKEEEERFIAFFLRGTEGRRSLMFAKLLRDYVSGHVQEGGGGHAAPPPFESLETAEKSFEGEPGMPQAETAVDSHTSAWDANLAEANSNRQLMKLLTSHDWRGLELLAELRARFGPLGTPGMPESETDREILVSLIEAGLVRGGPGDYSCTLLGLNVLDRIERASGVSLELE
jgi:hypothetical protein